MSMTEETDELLSRGDDADYDDQDFYTGKNEEPNAKTSNYVRNLIAFWLLGLCNNYAYVIMLSAAEDILHSEEESSDHHNNATVTTTTPVPMFGNNTRDCNTLSTGAILLADILPSFFIKLVSPFLPMFTHVRLILVIGLSAVSFLLPALSNIPALAFLGVVCASLSSGLGEVTLLAYSSRFNKNVVSTWSSGTGASGIFGALSYAGLTTAGVTPKTTLLVMLVVPGIMALTFWILLKHPSAESERAISSSDDPASAPVVLTFRTKLRLILKMLPYMIPLSLVYFAEYFINQGLHELLYFKGIWLSHAEQYRWYQVDYQIGVFISRSSVNLVRIRKTWIMPIVQFAILVVLLLDVYYYYIPVIWIVFAIVLVEGLIGGCAYVNTFYSISEEIGDDEREFCMGVATLSDTFGICIAGGISLPVHNALCMTPVRH